VKLPLLGIVSCRVARRVAAVDAYEFPPVHQRVRVHHPELDTDRAAVAEAGLRQWFRILARSPTVRLSMPSVLVDDMWHEFLLYTRDYAAFCDACSGGSCTTNPTPRCPRPLGGSRPVAGHPATSPSRRAQRPR
jgi:hypothetical protein